MPSASPGLIVVTPEEFGTVVFDASRIAEVAGTVASLVGLGDVSIRIEVDEGSPLSHARLASVDPIVVAAAGGAFEDPARIRLQSDERVAEEMARLLFRVVDRRQPAFADAPDEDALTRDQQVAWDAAALGRSERLGIRVHKARRRYQFLLRHGFSDVAERHFARLWSVATPAWNDIASACADSTAVRPHGQQARQADRPPG